MGSSLDGTSGGKKMSVAEKRQLVHELWENSADLLSEVLQKWTCQEILQIISAETGKEIKYNGLAKTKIIDILKNILTKKKESSGIKGNSKCKKNAGDQEEKKRGSSVDRTNIKRRRKNPNPKRFVAPWIAGETEVSSQEKEEEEATFVSCISIKDKEKQLVVEEDQSNDREDGTDKVTNEEKNSSNCGGFELEHCVKMIRKLECSGFLEKSFRLKFLTWYSFRATPREIIAVKAFINNFNEDPKELAGQLVNTFSNCIWRMHDG